MQRLTTAEMQEAVRVGLSDPRIAEEIRKDNEAMSRGDGSVGGYIRDWGLLMSWTGMTEVAQLTENIFFIIMEQFVGVYSAGRTENFRSTVAWRQKLDQAEGRWSQTDGFRLRFEGYQKRVDERYRAKQADGSIPQTKRGHIKGQKVDELFAFCVSMGEDTYAVGMVFSFHLMLRHGDIPKLDESCLRHTPGRGWEVKIVGGKGRAKDFVEWIRADETPKLCEALLKSTPKGALLFPSWSEDKANALIKGAAERYGWSVEGEKYTHHCNRRGKARELYDKGMTIQEICELGRWKREKTARGYIGSS